MNNFPLETELAHRMLAVGIEFGFILQAQQAFRDRIDESLTFRVVEEGRRGGELWRKIYCMWRKTWCQSRSFGFPFLVALHRIAHHC
jgi:hypothetical protein